MKLVDHEPLPGRGLQLRRRAARDRGSLLPRRRPALPRQLGRRDVHRRLPAARRELRPEQRPGALAAGVPPRADLPGSRRGRDRRRRGRRLSPAELVRCWPTTDPDYIRYHDEEWGRPVRDERGIYERLCLEGFQSGLSWLTILRKRPAFRAAFAGFDPDRVAAFGERRRRAAARRRRHRAPPRQDRGDDRERARDGGAARRPASRCTSSFWAHAPAAHAAPPRSRRLARLDARVGRARRSGCAPRASGSSARRRCTPACKHAAS